MIIETEFFIQRPGCRTVFFNEYNAARKFTTKSYYLRFPYLIFYKIKDPPIVCSYQAIAQRKILFVCGCDEYPTMTSTCYKILLSNIYYNNSVCFSYANTSELDDPILYFWSSKFEMDINWPGLDLLKIIFRHNYNNCNVLLKKWQAQKPKSLLNGSNSPMDQFSIENFIDRSNHIIQQTLGMNDQKVAFEGLK